MVIGKWKKYVSSGLRWELAKLIFCKNIVK